MNRRDFCVRVGVLLSPWAKFSLAAPQQVLEIENVTYLQHVPTPSQKMQGSLRISPEQIVFLAKGQVQFTIQGKDVVYVAAQAEASMRARTADTGVTTLAIAGAVIPPLLPLALLFHKAEKHLLSIEYIEREDEIRRLALFNVRDHSSRAVKKMIDDRLGFTPEYYQKKDTEEEERKREKEAQKSPAGYWEATKNTMVGDSQYARVLLEKGTYAVLIFDRYVGFRPEGLDWAKYRVPLWTVKQDRPRTENLAPVYKSSRLAGFEVNGMRYLFY